MDTRQHPFLPSSNDYLAVNSYDGLDTTRFPRDGRPVPMATAVKPQPSVMTLRNHNGGIENYLVVPYSQAIAASALSTNTKRTITANRSFLSTLRGVQLAIAIALVICIVFLRNTQQIEGWVIGIPVCVSRVYLQLDQSLCLQAGNRCSINIVRSFQSLATSQFTTAGQGGHLPLVCHVFGYWTGPLPRVHCHVGCV